MKRNIDFLLSMIYPFLITLFIYCYTETNLKGFDYQPLMISEVMLMTVFGILFIIGVILNIRYSLKNKETNK